MRIAQLAPPFLPVPPGRYGGTERVIHDLTEGLGVGLVSISHAQQAYAPEARWIGNAYHGIAVEDYPFDPVGGEDLSFLSRMTRDKAPHVAIAGAAHTIERSACRRRVEETFSLSAMVSRYEAIYRSLMR